MEYPYKVMRTKDLVKMGWPEEHLRDIYRLGIRKIAWKTGTAKNCPILFDTDELEKYRRSQCVAGYRG